jgi:hypothetical protein
LQNIIKQNFNGFLNFFSTFQKKREEFCKNSNEPKNFAIHVKLMKKDFNLQIFVISSAVQYWSNIG